jgi:hypothetical protein
VPTIYFEIFDTSLRIAEYRLTTAQESGCTADKFVRQVPYGHFEARNGVFAAQGAVTF